MIDFNVNELKENLIKKAVDVADMTKEFAKKATDKTKAVAKITRLTAENAGDKDIIKKNFAELGKAYYEKYQAEAEDEFAQLVAEIKEAEARIAERTAEIEEIKAGDAEDAIEVEFYQDDLVEDVKEAAEEAVEEVKETAAEIKEAAEEIVEEVKDEIKEAADEIK